jgi:hypothetical protein
MCPVGLTRLSRLEGNLTTVQYVNIIETHLLAYFRNNFQRDERIKVRSRQVNFIAFFVRMNFKTFSVFIVLEFIQPFTDEHGLN